MTAPKTLAQKLWKATLWLLALYFLMIAWAHITGAKIPLLFVYYNVQSEIYQDNIIAFFAFGWAVIYATIAFSASQQLAFMRGVLIMAIGAISGLSYINVTTDFSRFSSEIEVWPFWVQTSVLGVVTLWIFLLYAIITKKFQL